MQPLTCCLFCSLLLLLWTSHTGPLLLLQIIRWLIKWPSATLQKEPAAQSSPATHHTAFLSVPADTLMSQVRKGFSALFVFAFFVSRRITHSMSWILLCCAARTWWNWILRRTKQTGRKRKKKWLRFIENQVWRFEREREREGRIRPCCAHSPGLG